ncbi:MAG TPA: Insertion element protein [Pseudonocardiaceae bacterium]|nr:Insertion element protein [Pseudonocardiaceae bacterium]
MSERATILYCPYCAEEDLRPQEAPSGGWLCMACRRVFAVTLAGLAPQGVTR